MSEIQDKIDAYMAQCNGTDNWHINPRFRGLQYTDGVEFVAETCGAYWLIDSIFLNQYTAKVWREEFQVWKLDVDIELRCGTLTCEDGDGNIVFDEEIPDTDFPIREIKFYFENDTLCLPCER